MVGGEVVGVSDDVEGWGGDVVVGVVGVVVATTTGTAGMITIVLVTPGTMTFELIGVIIGWLISGVEGGKVELPPPLATTTGTVVVATGAVLVGVLVVVAATVVPDAATPRLVVTPSPLRARI